MSASPFSPSVLNAIGEITTGGSASSRSEYGVYRSATEIGRFFAGCNLTFEIGNSSRFPTVMTLINERHQRGDMATLQRILEAAMDPREYRRSQPGQFERTLSHMNELLRPDGFELREQSGRYRLHPIGTTGPAVAALQAVAAELDYDTVHLELERYLRDAGHDSEAAITAACSMVESVCRSILNSMGKPLPDNKDVSHLVGEVTTHLDLSPARADLTPDVKQILGGLRTVAQGVGALRTHAGTAHGRDQGAARVNKRIARFAVNAASAIALFLVDTYQESKL